MRALPVLTAELAMSMRSAQLRLAQEVSMLRTQLRAPLVAPVLATLTVLCERRVRTRPFDPANAHPQAELLDSVWVPTMLGGEHWMHVGEGYELKLFPQVPTRNFRWFLSGDPSLVVTGFRVGLDSQLAGQGGLKFGDSVVNCDPGWGLHFDIERRRVPS